MKVKKLLFSCLLGMLFCCQPFVAHAHAVGDGGGGANTGGNISGGTSSKPNADSNEKDFRIGSVVFLADFGKLSQLRRRYPSITWIPGVYSGHTVPW